MLFLTLMPLVIHIRSKNKLGYMLELSDISYSIIAVQYNASSTKNKKQKQ